MKKKIRVGYFQAFKNGKICFFSRSSPQFFFVISDQYINTYKPAYRTMVLFAYSVWIISLNMEFKDISTPLKPQLGCLAAV